MSTATKYHLGRNGQIAPCEANIKPCPLGGIHYDSKEEAQYEMMELNVIRNHWRTSMGPFSGWSCTCGWEPADVTMDGRGKVDAHAQAAHAEEVSRAKAAWEQAKEKDADARSLLIWSGSKPTGEKATPNGCRHCGHAQGDHGTVYVPVIGDHRWEEPTAHQRQVRMLARQNDAPTKQVENKASELPHAVSAEAWSKFRSRPMFKLDLEEFAMAGYRSYDASTVEQSIDLARNGIINKYSGLPHGLGARDVEVLLAHRGEVDAQLRPLVKQLYLVGHFESEADKQAQADEEAKRAQARASYSERARILRAAGL